MAISSLFNLLLFGLKIVARDVLFFILYFIQSCFSCELFENKNNNNNNNNKNINKIDESSLCVGFYNRYKRNLDRNKRHHGKSYRYYSTLIFKKPYLEWKNSSL